MAVIARITCSLLVLLGALATPIAATAQEKIKLGLLPFSESLGAVIAATFRSQDAANMKRFLAEYSQAANFDAHWDKQSAAIQGHSKCRADHARKSQCRRAREQGQRHGGGRRRVEVEQQP